MSFRNNDIFSYPIIDHEIENHFKIALTEGWKGTPYFDHKPYRSRHLAIFITSHFKQKIHNKRFKNCTDNIFFCDSFSHWNWQHYHRKWRLIASVLLTKTGSKKVQAKHWIMQRFQWQKCSFLWLVYKAIWTGLYLNRNYACFERNKIIFIWKFVYKALYLPSSSLHKRQTLARHLGRSQLKLKKAKQKLNLRLFSFVILYHEGCWTEQSITGRY